METTVEKYAAISAVINPDNGEVTLFISNEDWGPIVTGKNFAEAKAKLKEAFGLAMIANSYCATRDEKTKKVAEFARLNNTLEHSF